MALVIAVTGAVATTGAAAAAAPNAIVPIPVASSTLPANGFHLTAAQKAQLNQAVGFISQKNMWGEFVLTSDNTLATADSLSVIAAKYSLTADQVKSLQGILSYAAQHKTSVTTKPGVVRPDVSINGTEIYLTNSDMGAFVLSAAIMGPPALAAAINAMAWVLGGPVGGGITFIMTLVGWGSIINLDWMILQAAAMHEGIHFGIAWTPFPNYDQGFWCGCN